MTGRSRLFFHKTPETPGFPVFFELGNSRNGVPGCWRAREGFGFLN